MPARRAGVLVTGASSGIGEATSLRLVRRGFQVFGGYRRTEDGRRLVAAGVEPVYLDVTESESVQAAAARVSERLAGDALIGLVNNAGVPGAGPIETTPLDEFRHVLEVNLLGVLSVTRAFLPALRANGGRIVMISSVSGRISMPFMSPYSASKFGLEAVSDSLRIELLPEGVDVIVIEPGPIVTRIWDQVADLDPAAHAGTPYATRVVRLRQRAIEGARSGLRPEDVARAVERALTAPRPPSRILVLKRSSRWRLRIMERLPDRILDRLIAKRL